MAKRAGNQEAAIEPTPLELARTQLDAAVTAIIVHIPIAPRVGTHSPLAAVVTTSDSDGMAAQFVPGVCLPASFVGASRDFAPLEEDDDIVFLEEVKTVGQGQVAATPHTSISLHQATTPQHPLTGMLHRYKTLP